MSVHMINSLKTIAVFGCTFTSRYRRGLSSSFCKAAEKLGAVIAIEPVFKHIVYDGKCARNTAAQVVHRRLK